MMKNQGVTRRSFLVTSILGIGTTVASPRLSEGLSVSDSEPNLTPSVPVKVQVSAADPVRVMRGGIGASFHTISANLPGAKANGSSWSGSAWGGNPGPEDDKHWNELFQHAEWLGMNWCRVELEQRMYEPERRAFDWDNGEMRVLYRVLDWAESRKIDVFLQQMWADVAWNAYPSNAEDPIRRLRSAPYSIPEWAHGIGELVDHLVRKKKYSCIRWLSIANEPGHDSFSWWQDSDMKSAPFSPAFKAVHEELERRGLRLPLSGPDRTDLPELNPTEIDFDEYIEAYDLHSYDAVFDSMGWGYSLSEAEHRMRQWAEWAHARNKPFFLSEFGTMAYGRGHNDAGPACYQSGLKNASLVVRGINAGVDGFNRWSFTNRGDLDGQWQLVRTWDTAKDRLFDTFSPQPNAYYQFAMLSRFLPKYSAVLATRVETPFLEEDRTFVATSLRTPKGNLTVVLVNENQQPVDLTLEFTGLPATVHMHRYAITKEDEDRGDVELRAQSSVDIHDTFSARIEPMSIVVYSTYALKPNEPGLIVE